MEWLNEKLLSGAVALLVTWHWYDKKARDERFIKLETRMAHAESAQNNQKTQLEVMRTELKAFSKLTDNKLEHIQDGLNKVIYILDRRGRSTDEQS